MFNVSKVQPYSKDMLLAQDPLPAFINNVFLEHSYSHLFKSLL